MYRFEVFEATLKGALAKHNINKYCNTPYSDSLTIDALKLSAFFPAEFGVLHLNILLFIPLRSLYSVKCMVTTRPTLRATDLGAAVQQRVLVYRNWF
jgi:hypothetical protein